MKQAKELIQIAETKKGQKYVLGAVVPKDKKDYNGNWDCAEFVSWAVYQLLGKMYGCSNNNGNPSKTPDCDAWTNFWKRDFDKGLFNEITIREAANTEGAILLRFTKGSRIGHIAISKGNNKTIEAMSSKYGVTNGVVSGRTWDVAFTLKEVTGQSTGNDPIVIPTKIYRLQSPFMRGDKIKEFAKALEKAGFNTNGTHKDGVFGPGMFRAVHSYQNAKGLTVDGIIGKETAESLNIAL